MKHYKVTVESVYANTYNSHEEEQYEHSKQVLATKSSI